MAAWVSRMARSSSRRSGSSASMRARREPFLATWRSSSTGRLHLVGGGHAMRADRVGREKREEGREILQPLRHDMDDALLRLKPSPHPQQPGAEHDGAEALEDLRPDDDVGDARLVLERREDHARCGARSLADEDEAGDGDALAGRASQQAFPSPRLRRAASSRRRNETGCAFSDSDSER